MEQGDADQNAQPERNLASQSQQANDSTGPSAKPQAEYNKKWKCYLLICVTSLTNFVSVGEVFQASFSQYYYGRRRVNYMFGVVTFAASLLILVFDLIGIKFDFKSLADGRVEGWTLLLFLLWWVGGVISVTRAGSIGYAALNIYYSAWASLFACLYALDRWGGEKDVLTLRQLTRISLTLPGWWVVFWASIIMLGSAADASNLANTQYVLYSCEFAIATGFITSFVAAFFILSHYEFLRCCESCASWLKYGSWFELICSIAVNLFLIAGLEQLTGAGRIASTLVGNGDPNPASADYIPGSNIYVAIWTAFIASVVVTAKWKEARALLVFEDTVGGDASDNAEGDV